MVRRHIRAIAATRTPHPTASTSTTSGSVGPDWPCEGPTVCGRGPGEMWLCQRLARSEGTDGTDGLEMRGNTCARAKYRGPGGLRWFHVLPGISVPSVPSGPDPPHFLRRFSVLSISSLSGFRTLLSLFQSHPTLQETDEINILKTRIKDPLYIEEDMGKNAVTTDERALIDAAIESGRVTYGPSASKAVCQSRAAERPARETCLSFAPEPRRVQRLGIRDALEWAFGIEHARLSMGGMGGYHLPGESPIYRLITQAETGLVDTSRGKSRPAEDAERIAMVVQSALSQSSAFRIEHLAIAGAMPWSREVAPRLVPQDWVCGRGGIWRGKVADARTLGSAGWQPVTRVNRVGRRVTEPVTYTPCRWTVTAARIARIRREHLDWYSDLLTLRAALNEVELKWVHVTTKMPPLEPWREGD